MTDDKTNWFNVGVGLVCLVGFLVLLLTLRSLMGVGADPAVKLPVLVIIGVMALFATLALVAVTFSMAGLSDKTQALGLPEGSVRAAIAFSLVVIFSIVAIYFYTSANDAAKVLADIATAVASGASAPATGAVNATPASAANISTAVANANAAATTANDFAKSILAVVGTLMTAVTSFYFATRGVTSPDAGAASKPTIVSIAPVQASASTDPVEVPVTISGTDLRLAKTVKFQLAGTTVLATDVLSNDERVMCQLTIQPGLAPGDYDVVLTNSDEGIASLPKAFKVLAADA